MDSRALDLLRCPRCRSVGLRFRNEAEDRVVCPACSADFPVVAGVPRLAENPYVESFGRQWNRYDVIRPDEDEAVFRVKTGLEPRDLNGRIVLDAGCGGGRYAALLGCHGVRVIGIDLSDAVTRASQVCRDFPQAAIVQADLLDLPIADASVDVAFSIGVLHHCPDPRRAFHEVARCVRPGGTLAVWLYRRNTPPQEWINSAIRAVTTRTPARVLEPIAVGLAALGAIPVLNKTLNRVFNFSNHSDRTLRVCDNFDWYAPRYQSHHTTEQLHSWFQEEGFDSIRELAPARSGPLYDWAYRHDLLIGSGVNLKGTKRLP